MNLRYTLLMASAALAVSACSSQDTMIANQPTKACRDRDNRRVSDSYCNRPGFSGANTYSWFYMNRGSYVPNQGESFSGATGSYRPVAGTSYASAPSVSRGGFGHSSMSSGS